VNYTYRVLAICSIMLETLVF